MPDIDLEKLVQLTSLVTQGLQEIANIVKNKQAQSGKTDEEIFTHAEESNKKARELIDAL